MALPISSRTSREAAFERLVDERLEASYRLATLLLGDRSAAEDATHDAVIRAWSSFAGLRDQAAFDGWFRRIVVNCCRDLQRARQARPSVPLELLPARSDPDADLVATWAERDALERALDALSPEHREVVVLRFYADLSLDDIARALGAPVGTVKSRLHHAISYLRAAYDASGRQSPQSREATR
ncbi:MAG: RNA polymerase sigma factor [Chloroflexota bacterium]